MTLVVDASLVVAAVTDAGADGEWARSALESDRLMAPHLLLVEAANAIRRSELAGDISPTAALLAHADLLAIDVSLHPYHPFADRVWELRNQLTAYDSWYVALAEALGASLGTLDRRLARAEGPRCGFLKQPL